MDNKKITGECCGRPMQYSTESKCNYNDCCMGEYCGCKLGRIKEMEPTCDSTAVIPSITVQSIDGITNLANCLVHVEDTNTTYYVDDKHRIMITWAGPVDIPGYDMETNPNKYKDQIVTDVENETAVIYDKHGKGYLFGITPDNLQTAINNKLDEMAANGTLADIIAEYIGEPIYGFDTVADMKASTTLQAGDRAKTLGFHTINDGGGALYKITDTGTANEMDVIAVGDLYANLIFDDKVNIKQLGGEPQTEDGVKTDIKAHIDRYLELEDVYKKSIILYIPSGIWYTSGNLMFGKYGWHIEGDGKFSRFHTYADGTILSSYNDNQSYILKLGDSSHSCHNWVLKDITFTSAEFTFSNNVFNFGSIKTVTKAVELHHAIFGISDNIFFNSINGKALTINGSWGNYFKLLNFYKISNENNSIMNFETVDSTLGNGAGIIGNNFSNIMFEMCHGHLMNFEDTCRVYNNHFGIIRVEPGAYDMDGRVYTNFTDEILSTWDDNDCTHYAVFNMAYNSKVGENVFDSIEMNNMSHNYYTYNSTNYVYDVIIYYHNSCTCNNIYNNIVDNGMLKDCKVIYIPSTVTSVLGGRLFNTFNNFSTPDSKNFIFDVNGLNDVNVSDSTYLRGNRTSYTFANQSFDYYRLGNWVPAYKAISKRQYLSGTGYLYYDKDAINNINLVVTPRTDITDIAFLNTAVGANKKLFLRAKIPNGEVAKVNVVNRTASDQFEETLSGTGDYAIYEISLTNTWNVGDYIRLTQGGSDASVRVIGIDCFLSA